LTFVTQQSNIFPMKNLIIFLSILTLSGCATMFSGSSQEIQIDSNEKDTKIIVLGGVIGSVVAKANDQSDAIEQIVEWTTPYIGEEEGKILANLRLEELITALVLKLKLNRTPSGKLGEVADILSSLPPAVTDEVFSYLGLEVYDDAPLNKELKRGRIYAVIGWTDAKGTEVESIDTTFNWATLWNILNFGIGIPIDIWTGAWLKLTPNKVLISYKG